MKRCELRAWAKLWDCEAEFEVTGPWTAHMWEPLEVNPPASAKPYTCYGNTVIFYRDRVGDDEIARCRHLDLNTAHRSLVFLGGRWYEVGAGAVVQRDGQWAMRWNLAANTRAAHEANAGHEARNRQVSAATN